jgi:hypothetical protein
MHKTLKNYLSEERKERLVRAWKHLKPWQRLVLYTRAMWWSRRTIIDVLEIIRSKVLVGITYHLYKAHWVK